MYFIFSKKFTNNIYISSKSLKVLGPKLLSYLVPSMHYKLLGKLHKSNKIL